MYTAPLAYFVIYCVHQTFTLNISSKQRSHDMAGLFMESAIYKKKQNIISRPSYKPIITHNISRITVKQILIK